MRPKRIKKKRASTKLQETERLLKLARDINNKITKLKVLYGDLDTVTLELQSLGFNGSDFYGIYLRDNFKNKNVAFRTTSVKRFELEFD